MVGEQALLTVHHALQVWSCNLGGTSCPVNVIIDYAPNTWLASQPTLSWQARWLEFLQRFKLTRQYRPGCNDVADPLSRTPHFSGHLTAKAESKAKDSLPPPPTNTLNEVGEAFKQGYSIDENFGKLEFLEVHCHVKEDEFWYKEKQLAVLNVPGMQLCCIEVSHSLVSCGHVGGNKTYHNIKQFFWWTELKKAALRFVK